MLRINKRWLSVAATLVIGVAFGAYLLAESDFDDQDYAGNQDLGGLRVLVTKDETIYVAGTGLSDNDGYDFVLIKYFLNSSGELDWQWTRSYDGPATGSFEDDFVKGLVVDDNYQGTGQHRIYVGGTSYHGTQGNDITVVAWNSSGQLVWSGDGAARCDISNGNEEATDMAIDPETGELLVCGFTGNPDGIEDDSDALTVVFNTNGTIKTGWPETYDAGANRDDVLNAIGADPNNQVWVAGWTDSSTEDKNIMVLRYLGGGSTPEDAFITDYQDNDDMANDLVFTKDARVAVAGFVTTSGSTGEKRMAVYAYDEDDGLEWSTEASVVSHANAIAYSDNFVYATGGGVPEAGPSFMTVKLEQADGDFSSDWSGGGIRYLGASDHHEARSLWIGGTNVYVTGVARNVVANPTPQWDQYLTTTYTESGGTRTELFYDYFPDDPPLHNGGFGVTDFCAGQSYVTGDFYNDDTNGGLHNFGQLKYGQTRSEAEPWDNFEIDVGTREDTSADPLDDSDEAYLIVEHGIISGSGNPGVVVEVWDTVSTSTTELCFEVESFAYATVKQKVELWNYESGQYVAMDERPCTTSDRLLHITVSGDPDPFIDDSGNGKIPAQLLPDRASSDGLAGTYQSGRLEVHPVGITSPESPLAGAGVQFLSSACIANGRILFSR